MPDRIFSTKRTDTMPHESSQSEQPTSRPLEPHQKQANLIRRRFEAEAEGLCRQVIERALAGDMEAMALVFDHILPKPERQPVEFELPRVASARESVAAFEEIASAVSRGELTPNEANALSAIVEIKGRVDVGKFEGRLAKLEAELATR
jgi:hypothetical protein